MGLEMWLAAMCSSISACSLAYTVGLVIIARRVARIDVAVVSDPATLHQISVSVWYFKREALGDVNAEKVRSTHSEMEISASASFALRPCLRNEPSMSFLGFEVGRNRLSTTFLDI